MCWRVESKLNKRHRCRTITPELPTTCTSPKFPNAILIYSASIQFVADIPNAILIYSASIQFVADIPNAIQIYSASIQFVADIPNAILIYSTSIQFVADIPNEIRQFMKNTYNSSVYLIHAAEHDTPNPGT